MENGADFLMGIQILKNCKDPNSDIAKATSRALLNYTLKAERPSLYLSSLQEHDVLKIVCKPLHDCIGVEQDPTNHAEPVFEHLLRTIDEAAKLTADPMVRLAALLHDCGKADTRKVEE